MAEIDIVYNQSIRQFDPLKTAGTNDSISESCDVLFNLCEFLSNISDFTTEDFVQKCILWSFLLYREFASSRSLPDFRLQIMVLIT